MAIKCTSGQITVHFKTLEGLKKIYLALGSLTLCFAYMLI